jgi:hypothetical protein
MLEATIAYETYGRRSPTEQYFADGITEDLTTDLSRLAGMLVISRNTAFTYRNKRVDTRQIGREPSVRYVLEGSVRRADNRVRGNAQLIDAETDAHLWAERFDGDASSSSESVSPWTATLRVAYLMLRRYGDEADTRVTELAQDGEFQVAGGFALATAPPIARDRDRAADDDIEPRHVREGHLL